MVFEKVKAIIEDIGIEDEIIESSRLMTIWPWIQQSWRWSLQHLRRRLASSLRAGCLRRIL